MQAPLERDEQNVVFVGIAHPPVQGVAVDTPSADTLRCANPVCVNREREPDQNCAVCGTPYCGRPCQKQHWKTHKGECAEIAKDLETALKASLQKSLKEAEEWKGVDKETVRLYATMIHRRARGQTFVLTTFADEHKDPQIVEIHRMREQTGLRGGKATFKVQLSKLRMGQVLWVHRKSELEWGFSRVTLFDADKKEAELRQLRASPPNGHARLPPRDVSEWDDQRVMQCLAHNTAHRIEQRGNVITSRLETAQIDANALYIPSAEDMLGALDRFIVVKAGVAVKDPLHTVLHCLLKEDNRTDEQQERKYAVIAANEVFIQWAAIEYEASLSPDIRLAIQIAIRCFQPVAATPKKEEEGADGDSGLADQFKSQAVIV